MKAVVIVNGFPRSGKDTFVNAFVDEWNKIGKIGASMSSIDPVFKLFTDAGIQMQRTALTDNDRCALSEVGLILESRFGFRVQKCVEAAVQIMDFEKRALYALDRILFVHMREPHLIDKLRAALVEKFRGEVVVHTMRVRRLAAERTDVQNVSDQNVMNFEYDITVENDSTVSDLEALARKMANRPTWFANAPEASYDVFRST